MPYSFPVKVTKIVNDFREFDRCTSGSKCYLIELVNGLADILNAWERTELAPKVRMLIRGKVKDVPLDWAEDYLELGAVRI